MKQIICKKNIELNNYRNKRAKFHIFLKWPFISFVILLSIAISYSIFLFNDIKESEEFSKAIMDNLSISKIYGETSEYETEVLNNKVYFYENSYFSVIGIINIEKLDITYPILSDINKKLLKISPCRFYRTYAK